MRAVLLLCLLSLVAATLSQWKLLRSTSDFKEFAQRQGYSTDKTTVHTYEAMYWTGLNKVLAHTDAPLRIFEIGLGCYMQYGPGGSAKLWRALFPYSAIHIFEYQRKCGEEWENANPNIATLHYGDQSNVEDLNAAVRGLPPFDMMVDDGSHMSSHQLISLKALWPKVAPGGIYIVEDVHSSCVNWGVPGTNLMTGGKGTCMEDDHGQPTFVAHVLRNWLPVLARGPSASPEELPELESIAFYHEAIMFVKK